MAQLIKYADRMGIARLCVYMGMNLSFDPTPDDFRKQNDEVLLVEKLPVPGCVSDHGAQKGRKQENKRVRSDRAFWKKGRRVSAERPDAKNNHTSCVLLRNDGQGNFTVAVPAPTWPWTMTGDTCAVSADLWVTAMLAA